MVWWFSTAAVFAYIVTRGILILRAQRGFRDFEDCTYKLSFLAYDVAFGLMVPP